MTLWDALRVEFDATRSVLVTFWRSDGVRHTFGATSYFGTFHNPVVVIYEVSLNYSEPTWPHGKAAPYQIQLDMGMLIYAPIDSALVIVRAGDPVPKLQATAFFPSN